MVYVSSFDYCVELFALLVNACAFCEEESVLAAFCGLEKALWMTVKISSPRLEPTISTTVGKLFIISAPSVFLLIK